MSVKSSRQAKEEADAKARNGETPDSEETDQPNAEDLKRESRERFEYYTKDRSTFPAPMRPIALHGIAGRIVGLMAQHCESSLESLLFQFLIAAGNTVGRSAYVYAGGPWLFPNEYTICVGATARGRKGTAYKMCEHLFGVVAPEWLDNCTDSDMQSGEGIVHRIRDEIRGIPKTDRRKKKLSNEPPEEIVLDTGVGDKRLLIVEEEISNVLKMARRQGNTLTETYRKGWDSPRKLRTSNKNSPLAVSDPHLSMIGHTNKEELLQTLNDIELSNGFANRILWCASQRTELKPDVDWLDWTRYPEIIEELQIVLNQRFANTDEPYQFKRTPQANDLWKELYRKLNNQKPYISFIDGVLVRDTSHLIKLSLLYAILDQSDMIEPVHLEAALALCDYSQASARWIFAERTGNPLANTIFWALLRNPEGMNRDRINNEVTGRNGTKVQMDHALEALARNGMADVEMIIGEKGRRLEVWHAKKTA